MAFERSKKDEREGRGLAVKKFGFMITLVFMGVFAIIISRNFAIHVPGIPKNYQVDHSRYLSDGSGIYVLTDHAQEDYSWVKEELCRGNARDVEKKYKDRLSGMTEGEEYITVQNILGIAEVYLGDYIQADHYFNEAIEAVEKENLPNRKEILSVLYNNAGAVTVDLPEQDAGEERLERAMGLCEDPYLKLVIGANQICRINEDDSDRKIGRTIARGKRLAKREKQFGGDIYFVQLLSDIYVSFGFSLTGQTERAIKTVEESVIQIPDRMEYNMVKAALLGQKGYYHVAQGEYEKAEEDYLEAVGLMEQTVDEHSRRLALEYYRLASNYSYREELDRAWNCLERAIPGFRQATPYSKGNVSQGLGIICQELNKEEEAKRYYLKAYLHQKEAARRVGLPYVEASLENSLYEIYDSETNRTIPFHEWIEQGMDEMGINEDDWP